MKWARKLRFRLRRRRLARRELRQARRERLHPRGHLVARERKWDRLVRVARRRSFTPTQRALEWAQKQVGTTERPPTSNRGPRIDRWQRRAAGWTGYPWCGAWAHEVLRRAGVKGLTKRIIYTPYILEDARRGINGFEALVPLRDAKPLDLILFRFGNTGDPVHHVGVCLAPPSNGFVKTIDGNTSSGPGGSEDNGGGIFIRTRPASTVVGVARPRR